MRVFVLSTGRCGSYTFSHACQHATNYTAGHETRHNNAPTQRLAYPDDHIEVDNRLSWFTGLLAHKFPDAFYVHLYRDPEKVAQSLLRRWRVDPPIRGRGRVRQRLSILRERYPGPRISEAFAYPIFGRTIPYSPAEKIETSRLHVEVVTRNIQDFLRDRPHCNVKIETATEGFPHFWDRIGAEGDLDAALSEFASEHDQSPSEEV